MPIGLTSLTEFFHDLFAQHGGRPDVVVRNFCTFVQAIAYPSKDHSAHSLKQYAVRIVCQKGFQSFKLKEKFLLRYFGAVLDRQLSGLFCIKVLHNFIKSLRSPKESL